MPYVKNNSFDFMGILTRLSDLLVASVLFCITCLPLVTIGPSLAALYHTVVKVVRKERGKVMATYFAAFRTNFRQGFLLGLICVGYLLIGLADVYLLQVFGYMYDANKFFYVVTWLYLLPLALVFPWLFSYLSRFNDTVGRILKNAFILGLTNIGKTLVCVLIIAIGVLIGCLFPAAIIIIPGPVCWMISKRTEPEFKNLTQDQPAESGMDAWYNE